MKILPRTTFIILALALVALASWFGTPCYGQTTRPAAFYLVNADRSYNDPAARIQELQGGETIVLGELPPHLNVEYVPGSTSAPIRSVRVTLDGQRFQAGAVEGMKPYSVAGDDSAGRWRSTPIAAGRHTVAAISYGAWSAPPVLESANVTFDVLATRPAPVNVTQLPTAQLSVVANHVGHFNGTDVPVKDLNRSRFAWHVADDPQTGRYLDFEGYNAAHDFRTPGTFTTTLTVTEPDGHQFTRDTVVTVLQDPRPTRTFANESELRAVTRAGVVRAVAAADVTISSGNIQCGPDTLVDLGTFTIATAKGASGSMFNGARLVVRGGRFDNPQYDMQVARLGNDAALIGVTIVRAAFGVNLNNSPSRVLVQDCTTADIRSIKEECLWIQGSDVVVLGNRFDNSLAAQTVRSGGTDRLTLAFNYLRNSDADGAAGPDFERQSLAFHKGSFCGSYHDQLIEGRLEIGPLGGNDGLTKPDAQTARLLHVQVIGDTIRSTIQEVQVCQRTYGVLFTGNDVVVPGSMAVKIEDADPRFGPGAYCADVTIAADNKMVRANGTHPTVYVGKGSVNVNVLWK
jgi:hypothetical protein